MKISKLGIVLLIAALFVAGYFYIENEDKKKKIKSLEDEREDLKEILNVIQHTDQFDENVKKSLTQMMKKYKKVNQDIAAEIAKSLNLLQINQHENAVKSLIKIMEHLLSTKYENDECFIEWLRKKNHRNKTLKYYLDYTLEAKVIDEDEYHFYNMGRVQRNNEAHKVNNKTSYLLNAAGLLAGLHGIIRLSQIVYPALIGKKRSKIEM